MSQGGPGKARLFMNILEDFCSLLKTKPFFTHGPHYKINELSIFEDIISTFTRWTIATA